MAGGYSNGVGNGVGLVNQSSGLIFTGASPLAQASVSQAGLYGQQQAAGSQLWQTSVFDQSETINSLYQLNAQLTNDLGEAQQKIRRLVDELTGLKALLLSYQVRQSNAPLRKTAITIEGAEHQERFRNLMFV